MPNSPIEKFFSIDKNYLTSDDLVTKLDQSKKQLLSNYAEYAGHENEKIKEVKPQYNQTTNEVVLEGITNCFLVLGADRNAGPSSGYGGVGQSGAAAIDLVAGHMGSKPVKSVEGVAIKTSKNFELDAARIYISQMCNIDEYLGLPKYYYSLGGIELDLEQSKARSAIAAKADCIRIVARESIKLTTKHLGNASTDMPIDPSGIDIIAGYDVPDTRHIPQPMVKGDNLRKCLSEIIFLIEDVQATVTTFMENQIKINSELMKHAHLDSIQVTSQMIEKNTPSYILQILKTTLPDIIRNQTKIGVLMSTYFEPMSDKYINSRFNRVN